MCASPPGEGSNLYAGHWLWSWLPSRGLREAGALPVDPASLGKTYQVT